MKKLLLIVGLVVFAWIVLVFGVMGAIYTPQRALAISDQEAQSQAEAACNGFPSGVNRDDCIKDRKKALLENGVVPTSTNGQGGTEGGAGTRDNITCGSFSQGGVDPGERDPSDNSQKSIGVGGYGFEKLCDPSQSNVVMGYVVGISNWIVGLAGAVIVLMIIVGGVQMVTSAGSPDAVKAAKGRITNAVMSLVVLISMRALLVLISIGGKPDEFFGATVPDSGKTLNSIQGLILNITNFVLYLGGALSVVFIIVGALRYVASGGNQTNLQKAKATISYAVLGLIISISAIAIVKFIIGNLK